MKKLVYTLGVALILMGCSSNGSTGYKQVQVSSSESVALSALSNLKGDQKSGESLASSNGSSESPLKAAILKK